MTEIQDNGSQIYEATENCKSLTNHYMNNGEHAHESVFHMKLLRRTELLRRKNRVPKSNDKGSTDAN